MPGISRPIMTQKRHYGVDWQPYEADILERYVDENWTAEETVKYLVEERGLPVT